MTMMSNNNLENSLGVLQALSEALTKPRTLDEGLDHITRLTCDLMQTEQAAFLFRDEERKDLLVRSAVGCEAMDGIRVGRFLVVPERLKRILWGLRNIHRINWVDSGIEAIGFPIIVAPISVKGVRVGVLVTGAAKDSSSNPYDSVRQNLFALIAGFSSLVIENAKMYDLLRQHFTLNSLKAQEGETGQVAAQNLTVNSINNPNKVIRLLAQSFYQELTRAGFSRGHVATAAAQLLDCIIQEE